MKRTMLVVLGLIISAALMGNSLMDFDLNDLTMKEFHQLKNELLSLNLDRDFRDEYLLEVLYEDWENEAWVYDMKHIYIYDGDGYIIELLTLDWVDSDWQNSLRMLNTNNVEGYPIEMLYQMWEPTSETWMDMMLSFYTYDANWNMTEMLIQMWFDDDWLNVGRYTMTYNADNNPTYVLQEDWDFPDGTEWEDENQEFYTYDGLFLEEIFEEQWEEEAWGNARRITYTLEGNYHPADRLKETWNGGGYWDNTRYSQYTYDGDWNEIEDFEQEWDGGWVNFQTHFYTYVDGLMTERLTHQWEADRSWVIHDRYTITYGTLDSDDNTISLNNDIILSNYPNPFNPETTISFNVTQTSSFVTLEIYNLKGQKVKQLVSDQLSAGQHSIIWNGTNENSKPVSSGIYLYELKTDNHEETKKMILMK